MQNKEDEIKLKFIESIDTISQKGSTKNVKDAEKFLLEFEKSEFSWTITAKILKTQGLDMPIYLYSANILKKKLQYDAHQLPAEEYMNLAEMILSFIGSYDNKPVTQQLAIALALLYMRDYQELGNMIDILEKTLCKDETKAIQLLQIIEMIGAVASDNTIVIEQDKKKDYTKFLEDNIRNKALIILNLLASNDKLKQTAKRNILLAFQEWIVLSRNNEEVLKSLIKTDIFILALQSMNETDYAEEAYECLKRLMKSVNSAEEWPELFEKIFEAISSYIEIFKSSLTSDPDHALVIAKLFTYFAKQFCKSILTNHISTDLEVTSLPDFDGFPELEIFWYTLAENYCNLDENARTEKLKDLHPFYTQLVEIATNRICLNEQQFEAYETFDNKKLKKFMSEKKKDRTDCKSLLRDCVNVITHEGVILKLNDILVSFVEQAEKEKKFTKAQIISKTEGIFVALKTILRDMNDVDTIYIPVLDDFFRFILKCGIKQVKFHNTVNSMLAYASDFKNISDEYLGPIFEYLVQDLNNKRTADQAGKALISLSSNFENFILANYTNFISIASKVENNEDLIISIANAVGSSGNIDQAEQGLVMLCRPYFETLFEKSLDSKFSESEELQKNALENLTKLSLIFEKIPQSTDPTKKHMLDAIMKEIFSIILQLFSVYKLIGGLVEELCKMMKKMIKSLGLRFKPYLQDYFQVICQNYQDYPFCSYLYQAEIAVAVFGNIDDCDQILYEVYNFLCKTTIDHFKNKKLEERQEIIEDYLGMAFRYTKYKPSIVFQTGTLEMNLDLALNVFSIENENLQKANLLFLEIVMKNCYDVPESNEEQAITNLILSKYGETIIKNCIIVLCTYPVEKKRNYLIDIIFAAFIRMKKTTLELLEISFAEIPENILTKNEKIQMLQSLATIDISILKPRSTSDEDKLNEKVKFEEFCITIKLFENRCRQSALRKII